VVIFEEGGGMLSKYCTIELLLWVLQDRYGEDRVKSEVRLGTSLMRADILLDDDTVIEFDGPHHYTSARTICSDIRKNALCHKLGFKIVRVPFWLQLDTETAGILGLSDEIYFDTAFPHGWITSDIFPASFCEAGIARFYTEFANLPKHIRQMVYDNIHENAAQRQSQTEVITDAQSVILNKLLATK
jgi:very-short-patch-repair endonuclease